MPSNDFFDLVKDAKNYNHNLFLWPNRWESYTSEVEFNWTTVKFNVDNREYIPNKPGIYAFLVQPRIASYLNVSYLCYVGRSERSLRNRFNNYLQEKKELGRPKLHLWLNDYEEFVYFIYSEIADVNSIPNIEKALLEAFLPPANTRFSASTNQIINAFN